MKTLAETLLNYYKEHEEDFNHDIEELDSWNGILGDNRIEDMDYLDELYQFKEATRESMVSSIRTVIISTLTDMGIWSAQIIKTTVIILILIMCRTS